MHVTHGPIVYGKSKLDAAFVQVFKGEQRDYALRNTMDIDRICSVMEISRRAVFWKNILR